MSRSIRRSSTRGQTLVLFAFGLFLLALMVLLTLSIGMKVKEKMEVQAVADAAAYSNAAVTARTFNEIGVMNRAQIGHMSSMAAVQSLISWASFHRAQLAASARNYRNMQILYGAVLAVCIFPGLCQGDCGRFCGCAPPHIFALGQSRIPFQQEDLRIQGFWDGKDAAAGTQMRLLQGANVALYAAELIEYARLNMKLNNQSLARDIVNRVKPSGKWPAEWTVNSGADNVQTREIGINPLESAVLVMDVLQSHHLWAAMGSRGWTFTTTRSSSEMMIDIRLNQLNNASRPDVIVTTDDGSAYWANSMNHGGLFPSGRFAWADDHGTNTLFNVRGAQQCPLPGGVPPPPLTVNVNARLRSTDSNDGTDQHTWSPRFGSDLTPPQSTHTLGGCVRCPGMWPIFMDYNPIKVVQRGDVWGQPKNYAVIQRDYGQRFTGPGTGDPWNMNFNFTFSAGERYDNRGMRLVNSGTDIRLQTALSTGIAYYHRNGDHFREPPNFLNPFWRATLVPATVDADGRTGSDVSTTLGNAGAGWGGDAFNKLRDRGFKGIP